MAVVTAHAHTSWIKDKAFINVAAWLVLAGFYLLNIIPVVEWVLSQSTLPNSPDIWGGVVGVVGGLAVIKFFRLPIRTLSLEALVLIVSSALLSILTFPISQQLSAAFALFGLYGFTAGFSSMTPRIWRQGVVLVALGSLALPFALVRGTGLGFYLRLMTADAAAQVLTWSGHASLGAHDVLIFDNGIAQVDAPCSGLKSLFTGTGFFLAASLVLRRGVSVRWLGLYVIFIGMLLVANTLRVITLIYLSEISGLHELAEAVHMPLGLILFGMCCAGALWGLRRVKPLTSCGDVRAVSTPHWGVGLAVAVLALLSFGHVSETPEFRPQLQPPSSLSLSAVDLTPTEVNFFEARENTKAKKWMFTYQGLSGSMLVVQSRAANGLHAPEVCFLGNGISVNNMTSVTSGQQNYRWLTVDENRRNAMYWMQSGALMTDDFRVRLSRFVFGDRKDWTLVTILLDERHNPDSEDVQSLRQNLITHYQANGI